MADRPILAVDVHQWAKDLDQLIGERDQARAEAARLREVVEAVRALCGENPPYVAVETSRIRAALADQPGQPAQDGERR